MRYAPIVLFVYNRLWHTRNTVNALLTNPQAVLSDLIIYSDGSKDLGDDGVAEVRRYIGGLDGFKSVRLILRDKNLGLAKSITSGVTEVLDEYGKAIILEDDLVTSPYFLNYMNDALDYYQHDERVISIHGYSYPVTTTLPESFFLRGADCWGWATWTRGWGLFEYDGSLLLNELERANLIDRFDFHGTFKYSDMLKAQIAGKNDSWAIRWYASALLRDKLTLYPGKSLVQNIGDDNSGTHSIESNVYQVDLSAEPVCIGSCEVTEDQKAVMALESFFRSIRVSLGPRILNKLKRLAQPLKNAVGPVPD